MEVNNISDEIGLDLVSDNESEFDNLEYRGQMMLKNIIVNMESFIKMIFSISKLFIYTDVNKNIEYVSSKNVDLENKNIFTQNELVSVIHTNNQINKKRFRLLKCYLYNLDIEPDDLKDFIRNNNKYNVSKADTPFFHLIDVARNIIIQPTISQFQKMNTLYLVMGERDVIDGKRHGNSPHTQEGKTRKVKRVRFHPDVKQTRKRSY